MHSAISVNTLSLAPAALPELTDTVARLDARGISPDLEQVRPIGAAAAATLFRDAGLQVATLTHRAFAFASAREASAARERLNRTIEVACEIGAESVIMTTGGRGSLSWSEAAAAFAEAAAPCVAAATGAGIRLGIEPTSHLYADASIVHRLSDTVAVARQAGVDPMIDLFACWVDADIDCAIVEAAPRAPVVQISDYVLGDRGLPCRAVPGDGAIPFARLITATVEAGFDGWFDLEIIGPRLQAEGQEAGLRRAASFIGDLLGQAGLAVE